MKALVAADDGRDHRQLHVMDPRAASQPTPGPPASTGADIVARDGFSVAGNMLAGPPVLDETAAAYRAQATPCRSRAA